MGVDMKVLAILSMGLVSLTSVAFAAQGTASFYNPPYVPSACNGFKNDGVIIAAASDGLWKNGAVCNKFFIVRCIGPIRPGLPRPCRSGSVRVKVVDRCKGCKATLNLSRHAFARIANPGAGRIKIEYQRA